MTTLLDTGPLVAAANRSDKNHEVCSELLRKLARGKGRLLVPSPVVVEVCWLDPKMLVSAIWRVGQRVDGRCSATVLGPVRRQAVRPVAPSG